MSFGSKPGQCHRKKRIIAVFPVYDSDHCSHYFRVIAGHIVVFVYVGRQVVEIWFSGLYHKFPITGPESYLIGLVKFPVEKVVFPLHVCVSLKSRGERDAVKSVAGNAAVHVSFRKGTVADEFGHCRHDIVECKLMVAHLSRFCYSGPTYDVRDAYASFMALAFESAEFAVASEELRVCASFLVRTVVAREY